MKRTICVIVALFSLLSVSRLMAQNLPLCFCGGTRIFSCECIKDQNTANKIIKVLLASKNGTKIQVGKHKYQIIGRVVGDSQINFAVKDLATGRLEQVVIPTAQKELRHKK